MTPWQCDFWNWWAAQLHRDRPSRSWTKKRARRAKAADARLRARLIAANVP